MKASVARFCVTLTALAACGGCVSNTPTTPTTTAITITTVANLVVVGTSLTLSAADSTGQQQAVTWSSSDERVIAIDRNRMTAVGAGFATITARYQQSSSSMSVRSIPNFAGDYQGDGFVVNCEDKLSGYCISNVPLESRGRTEPIVLLRLAQTLDAVTGRMVLLHSEGIVAGTVDSIGRLQLTGTLVNRVDSRNGPSRTIETWSTSVSGTAIVGSFRLRIFQVLSGQPGAELGVATVELRGLQRAP